jgi:DNA polymerase-3 subunit delta
MGYETLSDADAYGRDGMNALDWLRETSEQPIRPVYAVYGDDSYLIRESIDAVARAIFSDDDGEAGISRFSGPATPLATVLDEVCTLPFFSRRRLVVVEEADTFVTKYRKDLEAYVTNPSDSGTLLLQVKQWPATTKLAQLVEKSGLSINAAAPRETELASWLTQLARTRFDVQLSADGARLLVELVGPEAGLLAAEVDKLAVYAGDSRKIERGDITKLVGGGRVETIWKTLDAATTGQVRLALEHLDNLLSAGEQPIFLLAAMTTSLLKTHHVGRLRVAGLDLAEACRTAGVPPFAVDKTRKQHAHLGPHRVDQLPAMLLKADLDLKGGSMLDPRAIMEILLVRLSVPRTD